MQRSLDPSTFAFLIAAGCASAGHGGDSPGAARDAPSAAGVGEARGSATATQLLRDADASPKRFEIAAREGHKLGKYSVSVDGTEVWPPSGPGCDTLVRCCTELASTRDALALSCLVATGRDADCATAYATSTKIALELDVALPAPCKGQLR